MRVTAAASRPGGQQAAEQQHSPSLGRRVLLGASLAGALVASGTAPAQAVITAPPGFKLLLDRLDGYSFVYPEAWSLVTTSGNDVFLRNPFNIDENCFVDISSPSSSRYASVEDLGTPAQAAQALLDQYLNKEFMSTRIGEAPACRHNAQEHTAACTGSSRRAHTAPGGRTQPPYSLV